MNSSLMLSGWGKLLGKKLMKQRLKPRPAEDAHRWNIVRGDNVQVIQGPQTGQKGKVLTVIRDKCRVIVEGVNMVCVLEIAHAFGYKGSKSACFATEEPKHQA